MGAVRRSLAGLGLTTALVVAGVAMTACTGDGNGDTEGRGAAGSGAPVIVPGRPGEPARTATPGERVGEGAPKANAADVRFVEMMIPHHEQGLEMTALVPDRANSDKVRALAGRIEAAQGPEITAMEEWLDTTGRTVGGHAGHGHASSPAGTHGSSDHATMPGMASPQQMARLEAAGGTEFDRLFLRLMITHHDGALTMSEDVLGSGSDLTIKELAQEIVASQSAEIRRMRQLLSR